MVEALRIDPWEWGLLWLSAFDELLRARCH